MSPALADASQSTTASHSALACSIPPSSSHSVERHRGRFWERLRLRNASGDVVLQARSWGLFGRRRWRLTSPLNDAVLHVHAERLWWRRASHGKGAWIGRGGSGRRTGIHLVAGTLGRRRWAPLSSPVPCLNTRPHHAAGPARRYTLRGYRPADEATQPGPVLVAGPEDGRLVVRTRVAGCRQGDALCEAEYGGGASSGDVAAAAAAGQGEHYAGCSAAISARADTGLAVCLLSIYKSLLHA